MIFRTQAPESWKKRLQKTGTSDGGWTSHYIDPETGERWIEYFPYPEDRAPSYFRREDIPSDPKELLAQCFHSSDQEDWQGAGAHCSGAFDTELIAKILEELAPTVSKKVMHEFGRFFIPYDNRDTMGMHISEINASYDRYRAARDRIKEITK